MSNVIVRWIPRTAGTVLLIAGTIGGVLSILVFSHSTLRQCPYARYMLIASVFDLMTLDHPLLLRILSDGWGIDLVSKNNIYCKLRFFTGQINSFVSMTMICLAAVDRWATTSRSVRLRQWSSLRIAHRSIIITIIFWTSISTPILFFYQLVDGVCHQTSTVYNAYVVWFINPFVYCLIPMIIVIVFGYGAYKNIRTVTNRQVQWGKKIDEQLTRALILQCCSFTISQVPYTIWNLYSTLTAQEIKSSNRLIIEALCIQMSRFCFYFHYCTTFYINLLASKHVRSIMKSFLTRRPTASITNRVGVLPRI